MDASAANKRARAADGATDRHAGDVDNGDDVGPVVLQSISAPVSPPQKRRRVDVVVVEEEEDNKEAATATATVEEDEALHSLRSPFRLTAIRDLPAADNVDALTVRDVFGDPRVTECWQFNYLHDLDFLMSAFDGSARRRGLAVHVVHGFWKHEDPRRQRLETAARRHLCVTLHTAFLPEPFGTHHTKMAVLLRNDGAAQVVVHTANLIPHDWGNMAQAVWRSPLLPLLGEGEDETQGDDTPGTGRRFKRDLLNYLRAYDRRRPVCGPLVTKLARYDFSAVRAALIGSVPGRYSVPRPGEADDEDGTVTEWGWAAVQHALRHVPLHQQKAATAAAAAAARTPPAEIVMQVSSMATLGGNDAWLRQTLFAAFSGGKGTTAQQPRSGFGSLRQQQSKPQFRIMFPTADEIRRSLDGYVSGTSIHTKIQSAQQQRQLEYMRPLLCHWANDAPEGELVEGLIDGAAALPYGDAGRARAAPHVKTYVRYGGGGVDWALLTSANLSKQAWGEAKSMTGEMRIASYELGVLVWPALLADDEGATMRPVFGRDRISEEPRASEASSTSESAPVVPLRIPYSLPLQCYGKSEIPWVATMDHDGPDWKGVLWKDV